MHQSRKCICERENTWLLFATIIEEGKRKGKGKNVKLDLSLCWTEHHAMKAYSVVEV